MSIITFSVSERSTNLPRSSNCKNGFHTAEDYLCNLLDREREQLEEMLIEGLESGEPVEVPDS
ncbi:type II toxin-antitoxin system ParD family antitoxin [Chamaesiphon sp. VAR_48_metabat_135_sub]|uniref:type II toxin-antitoxin system ParD family antitoxin n=1 Tax=Chamaesiphon sp. VAR_48_metabat_135_sub TaxID=2964699 RepID=UPI00286A9B22|nr:type II toxin-antitoxin system ParD family antitoxin [Chamaesiphon sp. VAR_48_metabat_135_sub]